MSPVAGINDVEAVADEPLTTKEGWRHFVDRQPHPPVLLDRVALASLSPEDRGRYDEARREYHADLPLVNTPTIQTVISRAPILRAAPHAAVQPNSVWDGRAPIAPTVVRLA
jgi:hypothetical protein